MEIIFFGKKWVFKIIIMVGYKVVNVTSIEWCNDGDVMQDGNMV